MKIEVGRRYKTRDNSLAQIFSLDGGGYLSVLGAISFDQGKTWHSWVWDPYGHSIAQRPSHHTLESDADLVEEFN